MDLPVSICIIMRIDPLPNYLVNKVILPEDLIHEDFDVVSDVVVEVHIDACVVAHD